MGHHPNPMISQGAHFAPSCYPIPSTSAPSPYVFHLHNAEKANGIPTMSSQSPHAASANSFQYPVAKPLEPFPNLKDVHQQNQTHPKETGYMNLSPKRKEAGVMDALEICSNEVGFSKMF